MQFSCLTVFMDFVTLPHAPLLDNDISMIAHNAPTVAIDNALPLPHSPEDTHISTLPDVPLLATDISMVAHHALPAAIGDII